MAAQPHKAIGQKSEKANRKKSHKKHCQHSDEKLCWRVWAKSACQGDGHEAKQGSQKKFQEAAASCLLWRSCPSCSAGSPPLVFSLYAFWKPTAAHFAVHSPLASVPRWCGRSPPKSQKPACGFGTSVWRSWRQIVHQLGQHLLIGPCAVCTLGPCQVPEACKTLAGTLHGQELTMNGGCDEVEQQSGALSPRGVQS